MAEYSPSKIIKDGNTYNFRDTTKIPLAGSNQISGSLIPSVTESVNLGSLNNVYNTIYSRTLSSGSGTSKYMAIYSGSDTWGEGGAIILYAKDCTLDGMSGGEFVLAGVKNGVWCRLIGSPNGTLTWDGQPIQYVSDQRLKQQITQIDDDLLTAWEDVEPVQFKYNDAVKEKSDNARLHTGYVVQQIDEACKKHNVDVSKYGLYCHEEYPEETEEVEVEQKDGTKTKERKVIREASEHYSLRYTEALIVECAYLRKKNKQLQEQIDKLASRLDKLEGVQTK